MSGFCLEQDAAGLKHSRETLVPGVFMPKIYAVAVYRTGTQLWVKNMQLLQVDGECKSFKNGFIVKINILTA